MTSKIPQWKVTHYWRDPYLRCRCNVSRVYSAHTPAGAVVQSLAKYQPPTYTDQIDKRRYLYKVEVERL